VARRPAAAEPVMSVTATTTPAGARVGCGGGRAEPAASQRVPAKGVADVGTGGVAPRSGRRQIDTEHSVAHLVAAW
jgi:hypothetical protein